MVLDPANGVAKGEGGCLLLQHDHFSAVEEYDWEALVRSYENGGSTVQLQNVIFIIGVQVG